MTRGRRVTTHRSRGGHISPTEGLDERAEPAESAVMTSNGPKADHGVASARSQTAERAKVPRTEPRKPLFWPLRGHKGPLDGHKGAAAAPQWPGTGHRFPVLQHRMGAPKEL